MAETQVKVDKLYPGFKGYESLPVITAFVTFNSYYDKVSFLQKLAPESRPYIKLYNLIFCCCRRKIPDNLNF